MVASRIHATHFLVEGNTTERTRSEMAVLAWCGASSTITLPVRYNVRSANVAGIIRQIYSGNAEEQSK